MVASPILAAATFLIVMFAHRQALPLALPFAALWICAPAVARWISLPPRPQEAEPLSHSDTTTLRLIARRTWRFFEVFVGEADHWLPPDNFQEMPKPVVAHRTSPTNIGLYLLSTLAARDFGWLGTVEMVHRLEDSLETMGKLQQFRGHFYNWYDTSNLQPLNPPYVSSVDSGNMAGHLLPLANGCTELLQKESIDAHIITGLRDTIDLIREALARTNETRRAHTVTRKQLSNAVDAIANLLEPAPENAIDWAVRLLTLRERASTAADISQTLMQEQGLSFESDLHAWTDATKRCIESHFRDAQVVIPWLRLDPKELTDLAGRPPIASAEWPAMSRSFAPFPV